MRVLTISTDRKMFEEGSAVRARMRGYAGLFERFDLIVFSLRSHRLPASVDIAPNAQAHETNSLSRVFYVFDAFARARLLYEGAPIPTVVSAQDPFESGLAGAFIAHSFNVPLHVQVHTDLYNPFFKKVEPLNAVRLLISRFVFMRAKAVRVVTESLKDDIEERFPHLRGKVTVLPIMNTPAPDAPPVSFHGFSHVVLSASRLEPSKNLGVMLTVWKQVLDTYPSALLVIAGEGSERSRLERQVKALGIGEYVRFVGWIDALSPYYRSSDIFLSTTWYEGYGLSTIEAAQHGLPVVSSNTGIARDLAKTNVARVCAPDDVDCFVSFLLEEMSIKRKPVSLALAIPTHVEYLDAYKQSLEQCLT
jgi:glycosyltransferase involved in cell wall biosynthesis